MAFIPVYILILLLTIVTDYWAGLWIEKSTGRARKMWLMVSVVITVAILFSFKYFNFFNDNIGAMARAFHWNYSIENLKLILPVGLSFHTFQSLSYVFEVYQGRQKAERHFGIYSLYVMFYPQLVAGPIERPQNLLPQFRQEHRFDYRLATDGLKLMAWGFFKKMVVADRLALFVKPVFDNPTQHAGVALMVGTVFFALQIYCDFSGYSDIAIGSARVMGFRLMKNFDLPYSARSVSEFWKRWHISLSTWFRDYVYIPLGGNRCSTGRWMFNLMVTFVISGLWHGASWNFVVWGGLNGLAILGETALRKPFALVLKFIRADRWPTLLVWMERAATFAFLNMTWIFFRAKTLSDSVYIVTHLFNGLGKFFSDFTTYLLARNFHLGLEINKGIREAYLVGQSSAEWRRAIVAILVLLGVQFLQARGSLLSFLARQPGVARWAAYYGLVAAILVYSVTNSDQFIYFQF